MSSRLEGKELAWEPTDRSVRKARRRYTYVPTLGHEDTYEEKSKKNSSPNPSVSGVWRTFVEVGLVYLVNGAQSASLDRTESCDWAYSS